MKNQNIDETAVNHLAPLILPLTGYELFSGRQYYLNAQARAALHDVFGLRGLASMCECINAKCDAVEIRTIFTNKRTGVSTERSVEQVEREASFRGYVANKQCIFTLNLEALHERAASYAEGHLFNEYQKTDIYAGRKFRGVKLSQWNAADKGHRAPKEKKAFDLSLFDLT